ncbi:MAG: DUF3365 domain-containing protein [Coriobacteriales bacterium]|nr:DUF3365 domain-containing protein [Coriobacteriales bacterium]
MKKALNKMLLGTRFLILLLAVILAAIVSFILFTTYQHRQQSEEQLHQQARAFSREMDAVWQFFDVNQERINSDGQGNYVFKGLYCSIVGKGVGAIFSSHSNYTIRYTNTTVRNKFDRPDDFEALALAAFTDGSQTSEYYGLSTYEDEPVFRYVSAIYLKGTCLECHGSPKGEIDVTGFPKEGLERGDLAGAISIIIPTASFDADTQENILTTILFFLSVMVIVALIIFLALNRLITHPLKALAEATTKVGKGNLDVSFERISARGEIGDLMERFGSMAAQLKEAYSGLEEKVADKTEELQRANEILESQREQLSVSNELLQRANERLIVDNQHKADFLAVMSHELRTPLTVILTFVEILESEKPASDKERSALRELRSNAVILLNMINDTLEMASIQAGKERLLIEEVDLIDVVNMVEESIAPLASRKEVALNTSVSLDVPVIKGDWERLRHVIENLASNAVKFTPSGGHVAITVRHGEQEDGSEAEVVVVSVSDSGIGVAASDQERIFERFTQVESSTTRGYNGSGLGLSVVKEIIELHGGRVFVKSVLGKGSTFGFVLPVDCSDCSDNDRERSR